MTYDEAISYIHSVSWLGSRPGLERIGELCTLLGNPQNSLKFIHVAGTNGKGSFSSMISSVLISSGMTVGTFTSPYVYSFNERFSVNGEPISNDELADIIEYVKPYADSMQNSPTEFELITAAGFEYFKRKGCDIVVLEAGMGGRLDSTNIITSSVLSVITGIALDHMTFLGNTTTAIAAEKAGIIKKGCPVLCGKLDGGAADVIKNRAKEVNAPISFCDYNRLGSASLSLDGALFSVEGYYEPLKISLCGTYQPENALLAISAAEILGIEKKYIRKGLAEAVWPARFEVLSRDPIIIFDGGHNPQGVEAAIKSARAILEKKAIVVTGVMADKDYNCMAKMISTVAAKVYCTEPFNPRVLSAKKYAKVFCDCGVEAVAEPDVNNALSLAVSEAESSSAPVLILGSLYMYRQVRDALDMIFS